MSFKITPVKDRQVIYASSVWDFTVDGNGGIDILLKTSNEVIPKNSKLVSILVEFLETPTASAGVPAVFIILNDDEPGVQTIQLMTPTAYSAGDVINFPGAGGYVPENGSGYIGITTIGDITGGSYVITVGYLKDGGYSYLDSI